MARGRSLAPPVSFVSGPTPLLGMILILLWCAAAVVVALAFGSGGWSGSVLALLVALLGASAAASGFFWRGQHPEALTWDGGNWLLAAPGVVPDTRRHAVRVDVMLDLQWALLVRSRPVGSSGRFCWLWLQRGQDGGRWHALRCALFVPSATA